MYKDEGSMFTRDLAILECQRVANVFEIRHLVVLDTAASECRTFKCYNILHRLRICTSRPNLEAGLFPADSIR